MIGKRIKEAREKQSLSREQLAEIAGYQNARSIERIELGEMLPSLEKIEAMAKGLGCSPAVLVGWDEMEKETHAANEESPVVTEQNAQNYYSTVRDLFPASLEEIIAYVQKRQNQKTDCRQLVNTFHSGGKGLDSESFFRFAEGSSNYAVKILFAEWKSISAELEFLNHLILGVVR